jgi:hypothetical protein
MRSRSSLRRAVPTLVAAALMALVSPTPAQAQPGGNDTLLAFGVSALAEWRVFDGPFVTRYSAHAARFVSDAYPGEVHTDVGVMRRRCRVSALEREKCQFRPKDGVDENVQVEWDPALSEVKLSFTYRNHDHRVVWRGEGDHTVRPHVYQPPTLVGASAYVIRRATASGSIFGDRVRASTVLQDETYMWEGGFAWQWIGSHGWEQAH